jgi:Tfp pilus assembly protein PilE
MRAFTLIETLVYMALLGLVMEGGFSGISAITETVNRNETKSRLEEETEFLESRMAYEASENQSMIFPTPDSLIKASMISIVASGASAQTVSFTLSSLAAGGEELSQQSSRTFYSFPL